MVIQLDESRRYSVVATGLNDELQALGLELFAFQVRYGEKRAILVSGVCFQECFELHPELSITDAAREILAFIRVRFEETKGRQPEVRVVGCAREVGVD